MTVHTRRWVPTALASLAAVTATTANGLAFFPPLPTGSDPAPVTVGPPPVVSPVILPPVLVPVGVPTPVVITPATPIPPVPPPPFVPPVVVPPQGNPTPEPCPPPTPHGVPEPATILSALAGLGVVAASRRLRRAAVTVTV